ncbi:MAG: zinc ribbon domain-containing protein [Candidatus Aenigmarchaeota archaeon]|nr:zinc ribbon domain-containing protein [Candidatus Aenigmarchaeota archaeon]
MAYCNECQTENLENAKFCRECGEKLDNSFGGEINTIICIKCDHLNSIDTKFCEQCGNKIVINKETKLKSVIVSALLEYHQWSDETVELFNDGSLSKTEANAIFKKGQIMINKLLALLKKSKKETNDKQFSKLIDDRIKDLKGELTATKDMFNQTLDNSFVCPYCKKEINVKDGVQDKEMEIECELCHKKFKCITGIIHVIRGKTNARIQYGAEPISITLKLKNKDIAINFKTTFRFLVNRDDKISVIYLKKFLSKSYNDDPSLIFNWNSEEMYKVGISLF